MYLFKIHGKEYKVRFTYRAICRGDVLDKFTEATNFAGLETAKDMMNQIVTATAETLIAGLQKYHSEEFGYKDEKEHDALVDKVLDWFDDYEDESTEDEPKSALTLLNDLQGELEKNVPAYHIQGRRLPRAGLRDIRVVMPLDTVKAVCRRMDCSVTDLLTGLMLDALQKLYRADDDPKKCSVVKVSVPVNLRPRYGSRTVRNFSSYVNLGVDIQSGYLPLEQLVRLVKMQKEAMLRPENLEPKIAANVELEESFAVRCLPLVVKKPIIDIINKLHGDKYCSQTLSNLGQIRVPEEMRPYLTEFDFILGRQRGNSGAVSCTGFGDNLFLHLSRNIYGAEFEQFFLDRAGSLGLLSGVSHHILA